MYNEHKSFFPFFLFIFLKTGLNKFEQIADLTIWKTKRFSHFGNCVLSNVLVDAAAYHVERVRNKS